MKKSQQPDFTYDPVEDKKKAGKRAIDFVYSPKRDKPKARPQNDISTKGGHGDAVVDTKKSKKDSAMDTEIINLNNPKPKKKRWKVVLFCFALLGFLALIGYFVYLFMNLSSVSTNPFSLTDKLKGEDDGRVNILLLGVGDPGHDGETLADTNMVVSLNTKTNQVAMISIPRDTRVQIPGFGYNKINNAHADGELYQGGKGIDLAKKTVENTLGIPIHYYVRANFSGLKQAVDAVGGIDVDVKEDLIDTEYPCEKNEYRSCGIRILKGQQHMDGATALKYARCRKGTCGDDFGRALRQQEVLQKVREKALSIQTLSDPSKVTSLIQTAANNIKTDLSIKNILRLRELTKDLSNQNIINVVFSIKPGGFLKTDSSSSDLLPIGGNFDDIQAFIKNVFVLGPIWKEEPKIVILNGTATAGAAGKLSTKINNDGDVIQILSIGNAKTRNNATSSIIDYTNGAKPNTAAYLEKLVGVKPTPPATPVKYPVADFEITVGDDFVKAQTATPTSQ
jgi:LCP family protein required for cell wall assembly